MIAVARRTLVLLSAVVLIGGCPVRNDPAGLFQPDTSSAAGQIAPAASAPLAQDANQPAELAGSDFDAVLTERFPDCHDFDRAEAYADQILRLVNQARLQAGLGAVVPNETLQQQATQYACEMISQDFFAHVNPITGSTLADRAREFGYDFQVIGENLAAGQPTPEQAFADWLDSPGHRANIMDPRFTELGVGVRSGGRFGFYWVQEFGLRAPTDQDALARRAP